MMYERISKEAYVPIVNHGCYFIYTDKPMSGSTDGGGECHIQTGYLRRAVRLSRRALQRRVL